MEQHTLSVIMPALNEEKNIKNAIESTLNAFKFHGINGEIIVINDGSSDNTRSIVEDIIGNTEPVQLINHEKPQGIGSSYRDGVKLSEKDIVVMFPGDNENDPVDALTFFSLLNHVDIVVPFIFNVEVRDRKRRLISSLYRFIMNVSFGANLKYYNGTVFYRRVLLEDVEFENLGFFYQAEILIKLIRKGYLFAEVPNCLCMRNNGKSKAVTFKSLCQVIKGYLNLFYKIHIKRVEKTDKGFKKLREESVSYIKKEKTKIILNEKEVVHA